ncbi:MAG: hypothetical protein KDD48_07240 [Bdellovibrionales bacterium]|nr:hypothetical protein [Bdellovibrionales bacterium]
MTMEFKNILAHAAPYLIPSGIRQKVFNEPWMKSKIAIQLRDMEDALIIKTIPLPYLEIQFKMTNSLPIDLQIHGCSVEVWIGKPVIQFTFPLSESLRAG